MRRLITLTIVLGLSLAACAGGNGEATTTTSASDDTVTSADTTDTTEATDTTTPSTETTADEPAATTTQALASGTDNCLVGSWTLDSEAFIENFDEIMTQEGLPPAEVTALEGSFTVVMDADGTYVATRDAWGFSVSTDEGTFIMEINGEESGNWGTEGSTLTIDPVETDLTVTPSMVVGGEVTPIPQSPMEAPEGLATGSEYDCSGDTLTVTNSNIESVMNRN